MRNPILLQKKQEAPTRSWRGRTSCTADCPSVARSRPRQPRGGSAHRWAPPRAGSPGRIWGHGPLHYYDHRLGSTIFTFNRKDQDSDIKLTVCCMYNCISLFLPYLPLRTLCFIKIFYYDKDCCKTIDGMMAISQLRVCRPMMKGNVQDYLFADDQEHTDNGSHW